MNVILCNICKYNVLILICFVFIRLCVIYCVFILNMNLSFVINEKKKKIMLLLI